MLSTGGVGRGRVASLGLDFELGRAAVGRCLSRASEGRDQPYSHELPELALYPLAET
jgi:hypothetical protein